MKELIRDIEVDVLAEYSRAATKFGSANNSLHESYAVILEEADEATDDGSRFFRQLERFWGLIKVNDEAAVRLLPDMEQTAVHAAAEWVQVAAMCRKAQNKKEAR